MHRGWTSNTIFANFSGVRHSSTLWTRRAVNTVLKCAVKNFEQCLELFHGLALSTIVRTNLTYFTTIKGERKAKTELKPTSSSSRQPMANNLPYVWMIMREIEMNILILRHSCVCCVFVCWSLKSRSLLFLSFLSIF